MKRGCRLSLDVAWVSSFFSWVSSFFLLLSFLLLSLLSGQQSLSAVPLEGAPIDAMHSGEHVVDAFESC